MFPSCKSQKHTSCTPGRDISRYRYVCTLCYESLEVHRLLAMVTVDSNQDVVDFNDGVTSSRKAISAINLIAGTDTIQFDSSHDDQCIAYFLRQICRCIIFFHFHFPLEKEVPKWNLREKCEGLPSSNCWW